MYGGDSYGFQEFTHSVVGLLFRVAFGNELILFHYMSKQNLENNLISDGFLRGTLVVALAVFCLNFCGFSIAPR